MAERGAGPTPPWRCGRPSRRGSGGRARSGGSAEPRPPSAPATRRARARASRPCRWTRPGPARPLQPLAARPRRHDPPRAVGPPRPGAGRRARRRRPPRRRRPALGRRDSGRAARRVAGLGHAGAADGAPIEIAALPKFSRGPHGLITDDRTVVGIAPAHPDYAALVETARIRARAALPRAGGLFRGALRARGGPGRRGAGGAEPGDQRALPGLGLRRGVPEPASAATPASSPSPARATRCASARANPGTARCGSPAR